MMKCPYCGAELIESLWDDDVYYCDNYKCPLAVERFSSGVLEDLIACKQAQDALKIAISRLTAIAGSGYAGETFQETAANALNEITAIMKQGDK